MCESVSTKTENILANWFICMVCQCILYVFDLVYCHLDQPDWTEK